LMIELTIEGEVPENTPLQLGSYRVEITSTEDCYFDVLGARITTLRVMDEDVILRKPANEELEN
jgi:hypothetical protein